MSATPPRRLAGLAAPGSVLAEGLTAARLREPSEDELRALESALAVALGGAAVLGTAASAATTKGGGVVAGATHAWVTMAAVKVTTVVVLVGLATSGAVAWRQHATAPDRSTIAARSAPPPARTPPALTTAPTVTAPEAEAFPPPSPLPPASTLLRFAETSPSPGRSGALRSRHRDPGAVTVPRTLAMDVAPGNASDLSGELDLIERAQQALSDDPSSALALAEEHRRRYDSSLLVQEREVIAVAALATLGRRIEARARAERFIRRFPESAHAARVRRLAAAVTETR